MPAAATQVFNRDCLIRLGSCIAPVGTGKEGANCLHIEADVPGAGHLDEDVKFGEMRLIPLPPGEKVKAKLNPTRGFNIGAGKGASWEVTLEGGVVGVIIDCRGRPFQMPGDDTKRVEAITGWLRNLDVYPKRS